MLNKLFLLLTSFTYLYLGGWAAFYPETYVELIGISINDNVGSSEIRSPIGGVNLLIGLFSFYAIFRSKHEELFFQNFIIYCIGHSCWASYHLCLRRIYISLFALLYSV